MLPNQIAGFRAGTSTTLGWKPENGVFATRSIIVRLQLVCLWCILRVEKQGKSVRLYVMGSDLLHGTPILDIKPYIQYSRMQCQMQVVVMLSMNLSANQ